MKKTEMLKAWKEALKQAQDLINFYKGYIKTAEDLEEKDTSELYCLGSFFNWCPNSGCDLTEEQREEQIADLLRYAKRRAKKEAEKRAYNKEQKELHTMTNTELLQRRFESLIKGREQGKARSIKEWEIFLQDCIEESLTEDMKKTSPCWWQHTEIDIFFRLMGCQVNQDLVDLIEEIKASLHE